jgi:hypothetical protein
LHHHILLAVQTPRHHRALGVRELHDRLAPIAFPYGVSDNACTKLRVSHPITSRQKPRAIRYAAGVLFSGSLSRPHCVML